MLSSVFLAAASAVETRVSPSLLVELGGAFNRVAVGEPGQGVAIYGVPRSVEGKVSDLLLTHARRDVLPRTWHQDVAVVAPLGARVLLAEPETFWAEFATARFHDYGQQSTKVLAQGIEVNRWVQDGEVMTLNDIRFQVMETPGFTRGAVSYVADIDGTKTAFTGDLLYGEGQIFDLYSFQDEIPGAKIRGYHGYGSRLALLLKSVRRLEEAGVERLVPVRGPIIEEPGKAFGLLTERVQALYRNYLSTSALHWYFKETRMRQCGERILGRGAEMRFMPYCHHEETPQWIFTQGTSRLLISEEKAGFLLDCGNQGVIDAVQAKLDSGEIRAVEGIFVTHYHDDHTDSVQAAAEVFGCPVYALESYQDVLENPGGYRLPAMTANEVKQVTGRRDGQKQRWREFEFTYHFYPGQTYYHGALFVKKPGEKLLCFIGDSFSPSGIDDYCVLNRNLLHEDSGYQLCFRKLRDLQEDYGIINEHIPHVFRFSDEELSFLEKRYGERIDILRDLLPWDDPNYGVDEQWAVFQPYGVHVAPEKATTTQLVIRNHSPKARTFQLAFEGSHGMKVSPQQWTVTLKPRQEASVGVELQAPAGPGHYLVTADIASEGMSFQRWAEALIAVE